jgi:hypothetical protein
VSAVRAMRESHHGRRHEAGSGFGRRRLRSPGGGAPDL